MSKSSKCYNKEYGFCIDNKCNILIEDDVENFNWVIQRNDGTFAEYDGFLDVWLFGFIRNADMFSEKDIAQYNINKYHLQNCKPVKIEIRIVGEIDKENKDE